MNLLASVKGDRRQEIIELLFVLFAVGELFLYLSYCRVPAVAEKRGELIGAVLAEIAVLELAVPEKTDLGTADITVFFVK